MKRVITTERIPIKLWLDDIEEKTLNQAKNLANLPFAFKHIVVLPDSHVGYGMPIGGVLATKNIIIPNAVGADIGCGMCAIRTTLREITKSMLKKIMSEIRKVIPLGRIHNKKKQDDSLMPDSLFDHLHIVKQQYNSALKQLGTLGSGNHFIEVQKGSDGYIWIMIHSGSRNIGKRVADYHNKIANELNRKWFSSVPEKHELAFLPLHSKEGQLYKSEMQYCVDFALANRKLIMDRITTIFAYETQCKFDEMINIEHNYAAMEHHYGKNMMIHRKGATKATEGLLGIIPGSQGTKSYIVKGKGNRESFMSCSHGAGRVLGRKAAKRELNLETEIEKLDSQGIIHSIRTQNDLDEASGAYKDINIVMKNQQDLIDIIVELTPIAVIKG